MRYVIVAIHDTAVGAYMQPFFVRSKGEAMRAFLDSVADPKMAFHHHPGDYHLCYLGEYDDAMGCFLNPKAPEVLMTGLDAASINAANPAKVL